MRLLRNVFAVHSGIFISATVPELTVSGPRQGVINVHIVSHTHDDVGWLKTVEEYYLGTEQQVQNAAVKPILDNVVNELISNPNRKFIYVEMAYFSRWWRDQSSAKRDEVRKLVSEKRLQFANGGWASNDEATPTFVDVIDQHTLGTTFIANTFSPEFSPTVGWQMDPFGHSHFQSIAYSKMGMNAWFLGRIDIEDFAYRNATHTLETIHSNILTGITEMYQAPSGFHWGWQNDQEITEANHEERIAAFIDLCMRKKAMYNFDDETTSNIMFTFGDDFEYGNARKWFSNIDKLIFYLNQDERFNAFYSTPDIYTQSRFEQRPSSSPHKWPVESGVSDWFPYCDGEAQYDRRMNVKKAHALWTGYFTSRPLLKKLVRTSSAVLELCRIAEVYGTVPTEETPTAASALWEALSVVQHHDGVSGTAKERVVVDYVRQLESGIERCHNLIRESGLVESGEEGGKYYLSHLSSSNPGQMRIDPYLGDPISIGGIEVSFGYYRGYASRPGRDRPDQASGTYIFRPDCEEGSVAACRPTPLPESVPHSISIVGNRIEWSVGPLPSHIGHEVVLIINTGIKNGNKFFTDSNGFIWIDREINKRNEYVYVVTDPVSANYYPVVGGIGISDSDSTLIVTPDRSVGGTSLRQGEIEIMVHRRLFRDDAKGMDEPLDEKDTSGKGIVVKGVTLFDLTTTRPIAPSRNLIRPPVDVEAITGHASNKLAWSPLKKPLPGNIVMTHFHRLNVTSFCKVADDTDCWLVRVMHANTNPSQDPPAPKMIDWTQYLNTDDVKGGKELTLNGGKLIADGVQFDWIENVKSKYMTPFLDGLKSTIYPGDIRTYVFEVQSVVPRNSRVITPHMQGSRPNVGIRVEEE